MLRMPNREIGKTVGIAGLVVLVVSWTVLLFPRRILPLHLPSAVGPWVVLALIILAGSATVAGIVAGRTSSRWWYFLAGTALLSFAMLLSSVAV